MARQCWRLVWFRGLAAEVGDCARFAVELLISVVLGLVCGVVALQALEVIW